MKYLFWMGYRLAVFNIGSKHWKNCALMSESRGRREGSWSSLGSLISLMSSTVLLVTDSGVYDTSAFNWFAKFCPV
jgi:hypothetical protein